MMRKPLQLAGHPGHLTVLLFLIFAGPLFSQVSPTPANLRMKVNEQRKYLENRSLLKSWSFRSIGPSIMSGRVVDIDANPADPTEFYVAYATGGLWHTNNNGQSFEPVFDSESVISIGDIAVNWQNRQIWLGSGEVNSSRSSYAGNGVYKSNDGGKSWQWLGLPESQHIGKIVLDPVNPNTAWVAVLGHLYSANKERGVYKTTDGGKSWQQTLYIDDQTGVVDLDINPKNPNELYAAAWYRTRSAWNFEESGAGSGLYKSEDAGEHWTRINSPGSGLPSNKYVGRMGIAVYPSSPNIVYAVMDNQEPLPDTAVNKKNDSLYQLDNFKGISAAAFARLDNDKLEKFLRARHIPAKYSGGSVKQLVAEGKLAPTAIYDYLNVDDGFTNTNIHGCQVYRSDDAGKHWRLTHEKKIPVYSTYGYYFGKIYVSPKNDQKIIIFGVSLQLSTDGGKTFTSMEAANVHADHHAVWIDPQRDDHILDGNDGGLNITYDDGKHWFKANTPAVGQFYAVDVDDAKPFNVYGGLQDNGSWTGPSNFKESVSWMEEGRYGYQRLNGGDGMQVQVDRRDNRTVYSGSQFGYYARIDKNNRKRSSGIRPQNDLGEPPLRFNWQTPILLSRHNQDILYYGSNHFHRSLNRGDSLETLSGDLSKGPKTGDVPFGTITSIAESPLHFGLLYIGTDDGLVQLSRDGGYTWTRISDALPQNLYVSRVLASRYLEGRVYVTLNGYRNDHFFPYLYRSDDYGAHWTALSNELPFEPLNVVKEDPVNENILFVGSDGGLYVSLDAGKHFMLWNQGLPASIPIHDIAIQERDNEMVLATHGRSLYVAKLDSLQLLLQNPDLMKKKQDEASKSGNILSQKQLEHLFDRNYLQACPLDIKEPNPADLRKRKKKREVSE